MNYYKRHLGDYAKSLSNLSQGQVGAYDLLLDWHYANERPLPLDLDELYIIGRCRTKAERENVDRVLRYFDKTDAGYVQKRAQEEMAKAAERGETNRRIAGEREAKKRSTKDTRNEHDSCPDRATNDQPSHKPLTTNQEETAKDSPPLARQASVWDLWVSLAGEPKRGVLGKLIREHGEDRALLAVSKLSLLREKVDPVAYVTKMLNDSAGESSSRRLAV